MPPFERLRHLARWSGGDDEELAAEAADLLVGFADDPAGLVVACRRLLAHHPANGALWCVAARVLSAPDARAAARDVARLLADDATPRRVADRLPFPADAPVAVAGWPPVTGRTFDERVDLDVIAVRPGAGAAGGTRLSAALRRSHASVRVLPLAEVLAHAPSHVLVEARAAGRTRALVEAGAVETVAALRAGGAVAWLVAPAGRVLPDRLFDALLAACRAGAARADDLGRDVDGPGEEAGELLGVDAVDAVVGRRGVVEPGGLGGLVDCPPAPELLRAELLRRLDS